MGGASPLAPDPEPELVVRATAALGEAGSWVLGSHSPARSSLSAVRVCVCACCMPSVRAGVCSRGVCALVCVSVCTIACEHVALNFVTEGEGGKGRRRKGKGKKKCALVNPSNCPGNIPPFYR